MNIIRSSHQRVRLHNVETKRFLRPLNSGEPSAVLPQTVEVNLMPHPGRVMALDVLGVNGGIKMELPHSW